MTRREAEDGPAVAGRAVRWRGCVALLAGMLLAAMVAVPEGGADAEDVMVEHLGLDMLGRLEIADGASLEKDGVALILHGTLSHHDAEPVRTLQDNLKRRGLNTLAVTLTLNLDRRKGMFNCALEHDHRHGDAVWELGAWVDWLKARGAHRIDLIGHARGGAQAALFAAEEAWKMSGRLVLAAPFLDTSLAGLSERYEVRFGTQLETLLRTARQFEEKDEEDTLLEVPGFLSCGPARVTAGAFLDYYAGNYAPLARLLKPGGAPTLVIAAGADELVPDSAGRLARGGLPPNVRVETIEGADHMFRDHAGALADAIAAFLKTE